MKNLYRTVILLSSLLTLMRVWPVYAAGPNLLLNGGFENGFTGWYATYGISSRTPNTIDGTHVGVLIDIGHSSVGQTLSQALTTTPGLTYDIQFWLRLPELDANGHPIVGNSVPGTTTIDVFWNIQPLLSTPVTDRSNWSYYEVQAVATQSSTVLNFYNPSDAAWPLIDGVSVTLVPEPVSLGLLALGAGSVAVGWHLRKRHSTDIARSRPRAAH